MHEPASFYPGQPGDPYPTTGNWKGYLVLYDFDGTLTRRSSMLPFLIFTLGWGRLIAGTPAVAGRFWQLLRSGVPWLRAGKLALLDRFYSGRSRQELETWGENFYRKWIIASLRPEMMEQLHRFRDGGATVALVSAAMDVWLQAFCAAERIELLCTLAQYSGERFTGRLASPNCKNEEKAYRIRAAFDLAAFDRIVAFGNSRGDAAMWELADEAWRCQASGRLKRVVKSC